MSDPLTNALDSLKRRIDMLTCIGDVNIGDDSGVVQLLQVQLSDNEVRDNTPRVTEYGFTSNPKPNCHAVFLCIGGDQSNGVIIGTNDPTARKKNLAVGEVAIYDDLGQAVYLTRGGIIVEGAGLPITINGNVHINGSLETTGGITAPTVVGTTDVTFGGKSGVGHVHPNGTPNTGAPV